MSVGTPFPAPGATGPQGAAGADGNTVLYGSGAPGNGLGVDGNFYIDTAANEIYGPKAGGAWPGGTSLIGPTGPTGPTGAAGPNLLSAGTSTALVGAIFGNGANVLSDPNITTDGSGNLTTTGTLNAPGLASGSSFTTPDGGCGLILGMNAPYEPVSEYCLLQQATASDGSGGGYLSFAPFGDPGSYLYAFQLDFGIDLNGNYLGQMLVESTNSNNSISFLGSGPDGPGTAVLSINTAISGGTSNYSYVSMASAKLTPTLHQSNAGSGKIKQYGVFWGAGYQLISVYVSAATTSGATTYTFLTNLTGANWFNHVPTVRGDAALVAAVSNVTQTTFQINLPSTASGNLFFEGAN